ncbi:MAG: TfpX/TfpZ family type IV pilin accessory protein [Gammaproteobacteria bacterium]
MSRWKASGIHLLLSAAIAGTLIAFMLIVWYPWPLFEAAGGSRLIFILAAVDVTLGPLITLIIYKTGKPGLKFDLVFIAVTQLGALAYGIHIVYLARPVYMVFTVDRFELVTAKDIDPMDLGEVKRRQFRQLPIGQPRFIGVERPTDNETWMKIAESALRGKDLQLYPQYYGDYSTQAGEALKHARKLDVLRQRDTATVEQYLASSGRSDETVRFVPLRARMRDAAVLLDADTGMPLKMLLIDPW